MYIFIYSLKARACIYVQYKGPIWSPSLCTNKSGLIARGGGGRYWGERAEIRDREGERQADSYDVASPQGPLFDSPDGREVGRYSTMT